MRRSWILAALLKIVAHMPAPPAEVATLVGKYQTSMVVDIQQRAHEFMALSKNSRTMQAVLPLDAVSEDVKVDAELPFLDGAMQTAVGRGLSLVWCFVLQHTWKQHSRQVPSHTLHV